MSSNINNSEKQQKYENAVKSGHRMIGRRAFLSQGLIAGVGTVFMPSLLSMVSRPAFAEELCSTVPTNGRVPFLNIDLAGGANLVGANFLVGGPGGQLDFGSIDYTLFGQVKPRLTDVVTDFGIAFHPQSPVLKGLRETTSADIRARIDGCLFAAESVDDSVQNQQNPSHWIVKTGTRGSLVPQVGFRPGTKAGHQLFPDVSVLPNSLPVQIRNEEDARSLAKLTQLQKQLGEKGTRRVLEAINRMSEAQLNRFDKLSLPQQVKAMVECGYVKSSEDLDKFNEGNLAGNLSGFEEHASFGLSTPEILKHAKGVSKLVLEGFAGAGTIELPGRDYHGQARAVTDRMDQELGQILGRCFTAAASLGKNLMIHIMSDGAVSGYGPEKPWVWDNQAFSANVLLVYRHNQMRGTSVAKRQVGSYTSNGIDFKTSNLITDNKNNNGNMARCVVANYLALHGELDRLNSVIGPSDFDTVKTLEDYVVFSKLI